MSKLLGGVIAALIATTSAHAACTQSDLRGRFKAYASTNDRVTYCDIAIRPSGRLIRGTPCRQTLNGGLNVDATIKSGLLWAWDTCRVTGTLVLQSQSLTVRILDTQLNRDKNSISDVGIDSTELTFMFSAQRI